MKVLVLNGGSSSLKATVHDPRVREPLWKAQADWGRGGSVELRVNGEARPPFPIERPADVLAPVIDLAPRGIDAAGHRVVHGGLSLRDTTRVDARVKAEIRRYAEFAPEHNRLEVDAMEAVERVLGAGIPQFAVFDTAFHSTMPDAACVYPGPYAWWEQGIRRFGFHGISHQYCARRAAEMLERDPADLRLVNCHIGNGASLAAIRGGRSIDTTMGFTPLEGLMMGTRSGTIDPSILVYLVRHGDHDAAEMDRMLNHESGLKGISGISGDMREVLAAVDRGEPRASLAFDVYVHRLCRELGGMVASLGALDALVFTAGIGENCPPLRRRVCERLAFLGIELDQAGNAAPRLDADIAAPGSAVRVLVIRTEEDWEIARAVAACSGK
jgi:acetate kinase